MTLFHIHKILFHLPVLYDSVVGLRKMLSWAASHRQQIRKLGFKNHCVNLSETKSFARSFFICL